MDVDVDKQEMKEAIADVATINSVDKEGTSIKEEAMENESSVETLLSRRAVFSSEHFKLELRNLPRFFSVSQTKKLFAKQNLSFHKIKPVGKDYMYVNFANEQDRDKAISKLNNLVVKNRKLKATLAPPPKDPMLRIDRKDNKNDNLSYEEQLKLAVCPLAHLEYEAQLTEKMNNVQDIMQQLQTEIDACSFTKDEKVELSNDGLAKCHNLRPESILKSPVLDGYRNKCEFSVGIHPREERVTVGFRLASYKRGSVNVMPIQDIPTVSSQMKNVVGHFESFVTFSGVPAFNSISQEGNWKQLTVRSTQSEQMLVMAVLHPQNLSNEQKQRLREDFCEHMKKLGANLTSINILFEGHRRKDEPDAEIELLFGSSKITEQLGSLNFEVSARSFFQINTLGAALLYEEAGKMAELDSNTVLVDVCCGTGTIGITLASKCKEVVGLELVKEAVEDARRNAEANNVQNISFIQGKAEDTLGKLVESKKGSEETLVAIVDPPRAGLHPRALNTLRSSGIERLVFISCDAKAAKNNFVNLCRPESKAYRGRPFAVTRVLPVDLFPHTKHYELILLFER